jgi:hypothetical protein
MGQVLVEFIEVVPQPANGIVGVASFQSPLVATSGDIIWPKPGTLPCPRTAISVLQPQPVADRRPDS